MRLLRITRLLPALACCGMLLPAPTVAQADPLAMRRPLPKLAAPEVIDDVALSTDETLHGVVISETGEPAANLTVVVSQLGKELGRTTTDADGRYSVRGLKGGVYQITAGKNAAVYRLWAEGTAPPNAKLSATLVERVTVRGQRPMGALFSSPAFIIGAVAIGAVAIPVAVHNSRDEKKSGS